MSNDWKPFFCLMPRFVAGQWRFWQTLERKYVDCIGKYDDAGNMRPVYQCRIIPGYIYRLPGGSPSTEEYIWVCVSCGLEASACECVVRDASKEGR